ncbi:serine hydrolase domain-containing protein [Saccharicrinis aurantiacus]|uniref:serine hydrolase domain-containing protein n=1 Tax=Saccharicrinis aurantiacus TaxID=1849719 RepID=UPI00094F6067|nr:serine hydrolase [Saccharicrinis aurantiacus]
MKLSKKKLIITLAIASSALFYLVTPSYLKNAVIYLFPGIDDYTIFSNRKIEIGNKVRPWKTADNYNKLKLKKKERETLENYKSIAYLIIKNDSILYEEYWDNYSNSSLSNSFSAAKSVVGLLIGAAIDDGYIKSIDQKVGEFIPEFNNPPNDKLKIKHLLTMSSGSNWDESYTSPTSLTTQAYYGNNITGLVSDLKITDVPGKYFSYKSGDTQLLSLVLKNATEKSLSDYASEKLWKPLGCEREALWSLDKNNGTEKAYCCLNSNARDFAKIGELVLKDGLINNKQIISKDFIQSATSPANYLIDSDDNKPVNHYGYQWWIINHEGDKIPYARGILGQYIFVLKKENAIVVRLGHKRSKNLIDHHPSDCYEYLTTAKRLLNK